MKRGPFYYIPRRTLVRSRYQPIRIITSKPFALCCFPSLDPSHPLLSSPSDSQSFPRDMDYSRFGREG